MKSSAILTILLLFATTLNALEIEWPEQRFIHISENQPIDEFLKEFFTRQGHMVKISDAVKGSTVSGKFNQNPVDVIDQISKAFDLVWYYDGKMVHIYKSHETETKMILLKHISTEVFDDIITKMNLVDEKFPLKYFPQERIISVFGPANFVKAIEEAASIIDTPFNTIETRKKAVEMPKVIRVFKLKHAWADDKTLYYEGRSITIQGVATILKQMLSAQAPTDAIPNPGTARQNRMTMPKRNSLQGLAIRNNGNQPALATHSAANLFNRSTAPPPPARHQGDPGATGIIQAATRLNAVVVKDTLFNMPFYENLIEELDVPLRLVEIRATIVDVASEAVKSLGINWRGGLGSGDNQIVGSFKPTPRGVLPNLNLDSRSGVISDFNNGFSVSTIIGNLVDDFLIARINAMEDKGFARIVSRPSVITFDNIEAQFKHTDTFFVRVAGEDEANLFEISTGINLRVTPHLITEAGRHRIQLVVNIEDGKLTEGQVDSIPIITRSNVNTQAVISENESLLIGGLIHEDLDNVHSKVPVLGDTPILGNFFRHKKSTKQKLERLFLISPKILTDKHGRARTSQTQSKKTKPKSQPEINFGLFEKSF